MLGGGYCFIFPQIPLLIPTSCPANYRTLLTVVRAVFITYLQECGYAHKICTLLQCFQIVTETFVVQLGLSILHLCVWSDFTHKLPNSISAESQVPGETLQSLPPQISFLIPTSSFTTLSCHNLANAETIKILLGLSWCHYIMQSAVPIDNSYFLYYDFYSLNLLSTPGIQAPGINLKKNLLRQRWERNTLLKALT